MSNRFYNVLNKSDYDLPLYITSTGYWINQHIIIRENGWKHYQWLQCTNGQGSLTLGGKTVPISKGQGILLNPNVSHSYWPVEEPWTIYWVEFDGILVDQLLRAFHFTESSELYVTKWDPIFSKVQEINHLFRIKKGVVPAHETSQLLYCLLVDISRYTSVTETRQKLHLYDRLKPALTFIEDSYHKSINLQDIADILLITPQYTCRMFMQILESSPIDYLNQYRISKAKEFLLEYPSRGIKAVALDVGFESPSYFNKLFRRIEGMTPSQFRSMHQSR